MTKKKDPAKLARKRMKKEQALLEAQIKQSNEKTIEAKLLIETPKQPTPSNYIKALDLLNEAATLNPDNYDIYILKGNIYKILNKIEDAICNYTTALKLEPTSVTALEGRASCFQLLKQFEKAKDDYTKIISIQPDSDFAFNMRGVVCLRQRPMSLLMKNSEFEAIVSDFKTALRLNEDNYFANCNLGKVYADHRLYELSIEQYKIAMKKKEYYPYAVYRCACACMSLASEKRKEEERLVSELKKHHDIGDMIINNNNNKNLNFNSSTSSLADTLKGGSLLLSSALPPLYNNNNNKSIQSTMTVEEQIEKENLLNKTREIRKQLLNDAISGFKRIINVEAKCEEITAVIHLGMCYYDINEYEKSKEELSFALKFIREKQEEYNNNNNNNNLNSGNMDNTRG
eukprot:Tbor_TRINITY_DN5773_c3_g1::TRINITY_DN5773_c3_g1_i7::g.20531::m.20531